MLYVISNDNTHKTNVKIFYGSVTRSLLKSSSTLSSVI